MGMYYVVWTKDKKTRNYTKFVKKKKMGYVKSLHSTYSMNLSIPLTHIGSVGN